MKTKQSLFLLNTRRLPFLALLLTVQLLLAACAGQAMPSTVTAVQETATTPATETAEPAVSATSPAETEVIPTGTGQAGPRLVVQLPDNSIAFVSLDGQQTPIAASAPQGLFAAGFGRHAMQDGPLIYARSGWVQPANYVIDTVSGKVSPLTFLQQDTHGLAVRPLMEGVDPPASLAWGTFKDEGGTSTSLRLSAPDGTEIPVSRELSDVTFQPGQEFAFVPLRWGPDGSLYYSRMPIGIGGFIPYIWFIDVWRYEPASGQSTQVVPSPGPGQVCLDELSSDIRLLATMCEPGQIVVLDLDNNLTTRVSLPEGNQDALVGSVRFSPGGDRLVYGMFTGTPDQQSSAVAISDSLGGTSTVIAKSEAPGFYAPLAWLDEETILVHFSPQDESAPASLWLLKADGSQFSQLVEGGFLGIIP
jgi:hypothetical protein